MESKGHKLVQERRFGGTAKLSVARRIGIVVGSPAPHSSHMTETCRSYGAWGNIVADVAAIDMALLAELGVPDLVVVQEVRCSHVLGRILIWRLRIGRIASVQ